MTLVVLYGKPGCCLCDEARATVAAVARGRRVRVSEVDVSTDPALERRYGERIPVLTVDGAEAFELGVDAGALARRLDRVGA